MNSRFHLGAEDNPRPFSALQSESCKHETTWPHCFCVCLLLGSDNPLPEKCTMYPRIVTSLPATCTVLHKLTKQCTFALESWYYHHDIFRLLNLHGYDWSELLWPISNVHLFRDISCLLGFCRVCQENFPPNWLKRIPIVIYA